MQKEQEFLAPEKYLDPASDHDGSKLQQLFNIAEDGLADNIIDTYLSGDSFYLEKLAENINLNKSEKYSEVQLYPCCIISAISPLIRYCQTQTG